ncbi:hypothetical protein BsWGS_21909 [Bradybaena similaris]
MASGVKVDEDTVNTYNDMKLRKRKLRYFMMAIDNADGLIKVVECKERDGSRTQEQEFNDFIDQLPLDIGRYCIIDLTIPQKNGAQKDIMFLITWCPSNAPTKSHIMYTTSKKALVDKIREGFTEVQANGKEDLLYSEFLERGCR